MDSNMHGIFQRQKYGSTESYIHIKYCESYLVTVTVINYNYRSLGSWYMCVCVLNGLYCCARQEELTNKAIAVEQQIFKRRTFLNAEDSMRGFRFDWLNSKLSFEII